MTNKLKIHRKTNIIRQHKKNKLQNQSKKSETATLGKKEKGNHVKMSKTRTRQPQKK